jgi:hypothetical protein
MKTFGQFMEDGVGGGGVATGVAGVAGAGNDKSTVPVSVRAQRRIQQGKSKFPLMRRKFI